MNAIVSPALSASLLALIATALLSSGCSSLSPAPKKRTQNVTRVRILERELKRQTQLLEELKERNLVLERRDLNRRSPTRVPVPFDPSAANDRIQLPQAAAAELSQNSLQSAGVSIASLPAAPEVIKAPVPRAPKSLPPKMAAPVSEAKVNGEQLLYSKLIASYRKKNTAEAEKTLQLLLKSYPESVHADNALFLTGTLLLEQGDLVGSDVQMGRILRLYPHGNKAVSALFARAIIAKRKNNTVEARRLLTQVRERYPGSPESARVKMELKLLEMKTTRTGAPSDAAAM